MLETTVRVVVSRIAVAEDEICVFSSKRNKRIEVFSCSKILAEGMARTGKPLPY